MYLIKMYVEERGIWIEKMTDWKFYFWKQKINSIVVYKDVHFAVSQKNSRKEKYLYTR